MCVLRKRPVGENDNSFSFILKPSTSSGPGEVLPLGREYLFYRNLLLSCCKRFSLFHPIRGGPMFPTLPGRGALAAAGHCFRRSVVKTARRTRQMFRPRNGEAANSRHIKPRKKPARSCTGYPQGEARKGGGNQKDCRSTRNSIIPGRHVVRGDTTRV